VVRFPNALRHGRDFSFLHLSSAMQTGLRTVHRELYRVMKKATGG
jgi:hypothetical protein